MQTLKHYFSAVKNYALAHKVISAVIVVVVLGGGWWLVGKASAAPAQTHYVLGTAQRGTIVSSVSDSGAVSAEDEIDIKPQVSGTITWIGVKAGQTVRAGQALMSIDSTDAQQSVTDAKSALAAAQLQYQKDSAQAPISYQNDQDSLTTAQQNLSTAYNDTYDNLSTTYLDLPGVMTAANDILYGYDFDTSKSLWNMNVLLNLFNDRQDTSALTDAQARAISDYNAANAAYTAAVAQYKTTSRSSDSATLEQILSQSVSATTAVAQALQSELNFLGAASDLAQTYNTRLPSAFTTLQSSARQSLSTANGDLSTLLAQQKTLTQDKQSITTAQQNITLDQVGNTDAGTDPISLQIEKNNLQKQEEDLATLEQNLAEYTIVAPFAGTLATVDAKVGDQAGSASVATIITTSQIATLSLNEVDAAKVAVGDKATLTFDAVDGLTLTGTVAEIDTIGTVTQGVVSYSVQITFDSQDSRIKPGMTVDAAIQTAAEQNALEVPSSAVKTLNGASYVLAFDPPLATSTVAAAGTAGVVSSVAPAQIPVETGISDDTNVEITSGLTEGQQIVVRTVTAAAAASAATASRTTAGGTAAGAARGGAAGFGGGGAAGIRL